MKTKPNVVTFEMISKDFYKMLAEQRFDQLSKEEKNNLPLRQPLHQIIIYLIVMLFTLIIIVTTIDYGIAYFRNEKSLMETFFGNKIPSTVNNISLGELTKPAIIKFLNSNKDTIYENKKLKRVKFYEYDDKKSVIGLNFSKSNLHKELLKNLPDGYNSDSLGLKNTTLFVQIFHFTEGDEWQLHYTLWHKGDIILSSNGDNWKEEFVYLPNMKKYGYK